MTYNRQARLTFAGLAIFVCALALAACSDPPDSIPEIPSLQTATPIPAPALEAAPTPPPARTAVIPGPVTPTPIPTMPPAASTIILRLAIAPANAEIPYDRDDWKLWIDADDDCRNTRHEVLLSESTIAAEFGDTRQCKVVAGNWIDPFTGNVFTDPGDLDIDHMVPLANAHRSGGHAWDEDRKSSYANDLAYPGHLIAVSASANRSKGHKGPDEWRPPNSAHWCQYALDWATIKREWNLTATQAEANALSDMLSACDTRVFIQAVPAGENSQNKETATPTPTPAPRVPSPTATPIPTPALIPTPTSAPFQDRNCSDFDTWSEAQTFFEAEGGPDSDPHRLDMDGDGAACQSLPGAPTGATIPTPTPTPPYVEFPRPILVRGCSDFAAWSEAQAFFESQGGPDSDPHGLDMDGDGVACLSLPGAPNGGAPPPNVVEVALLNPTCSDFANWNEAQAFFLSHGGPASDQYNLDTDGNGIPCQSLIGAPAPTSTPTPTPTPIQDRNCSDFDTWEEAQSFYESEGGPASDPHRLDGDGDGIACQSLRDAARAPTPTSSNTSRNTSRDTHNCSDFDTWSEAQNFFESQGGPASDPHRLDRDGDGVACQSLPGAPGSQSTSKPSATPAPTPVPTPQTSTTTPTVLPTLTPTPEPQDTHNCSDFSTWREAQSFFESEGGTGSDPHNLDGNDDGVACQSLPGAPGSKSTSKSPSNPTPTPASESQDTHNCSDFSTWQEAQSFFESEGGPGFDPHNLDGNDDGIVCQSLPGAPRTPSQTRASDTTPAPKSEDTHNCSDFDTWQEAQSFFESEGGPAHDPHNLDGNDDGIACQSLPGAP